ncbi:MAG: squalene/phytoene synthase family protein, partial [Gammaproteobacteria bacterium]|nr:squalene/phytoene synthase family protein [Gammaproteobacteria bacterium]
QGQPVGGRAAEGLARDDFRRFAPLAKAAPPPQAIALIAAEVRWARALMAEGAPLVHRLPGRIGWELRLVVQGGLRILDKIEAAGCDSFTKRPVIGKADAPLLAWRALRMRRQSAK